MRAKVRAAAAGFIVSLVALTAYWWCCSHVTIGATWFFDVAYDDFGYEGCFVWSRVAGVLAVASAWMSAWALARTLPPSDGLRETTRVAGPAALVLVVSWMLFTLCMPGPEWPMTFAP